MAADDRQKPKDDPSTGLTPVQIAVGLGLAASAWVFAELLRRFM